MTMAVLIRPTAIMSVSESDNAAWVAWLQREHLESWRPQEWDGGNWLFRGDLLNDTTCAWPCSVVSCGIGITTRNGLCMTCRAAHKQSGLSREEFVTIHVAAAARRAPMRARACSVGGGERPCPRAATQRGLCSAHADAWKRHARRGTAMPRTEWARTVAKTLPPLPECRVRGCDTASDSPSGLCPNHRKHWRKAEESGTAASAIEVWIDRQAPWLSMADFSLSPLAPVVRREVLYALQQRDLRGVRMDPGTVRRLVRAWADVTTLANLDGEDCPVSGFNAASHWRELIGWVKAAFDRHRGIDPATITELNLTTAGVTSLLTKSGRRGRASTAVDLTPVRQPWLRRLLWEWVHAVQPNSHGFRSTLQACTLAATTLSLKPGGGQAPAALRLTDMDAVIASFGDARQLDGTLYSYGVRTALRRHFFELLDFGRGEGLLDDLSVRFAANASHTIPRVEKDEDEAAKAIPEFVIQQLDTHLESFGANDPRFPRSGLSESDLAWTLQTAYMVMRDTGRRPREFCGLRLDCLKYDQGEHHLIWDNFKKKRMRRLLPITGQTAEVIQRWQRHRRELRVTPASRDYLFPASTSDRKYAHMDSGDFSRALRFWVDGLPTLDSDVPGEDGQPLPFDRSRIFPYAFRSSFAQRHADAGTDIDVLMDLMDHRSPDVTMTYYKVTMERKRSAVATLRLHSVDREGQSAPFSSNLSYESKSVAVPFGNCIEPSNVKAGGKKCAIRFQCAGCGFYRPDPSYLPAIEDHIRALKADREMAEAMDADAFVIRNLTDQIEAFQGVIERMNARMTDLPAEIQAEVEEASRVLRKVRAGGRALLPVTVIQKSEAPA
ncbi:tyrosine-type recombinase/integrase [Streptomyces tailanensis]|uniref:tyrosine-type recombinase/integrase n=1 Tax=Streptomyces tailanensis TaxID=2569858 RepID=UPI00122E07ED|nr:tyrosine-type recombinase/integrase [Streptomyces tailanensis]